MVAVGRVRMEVPVQWVVDARLFGCELQKVGDVVVRHSVFSFG